MPPPLALWFSSGCSCSCCCCSCCSGGTSVGCDARAGLGTTGEKTKDATSSSTGSGTVLASAERCALILSYETTESILSSCTVEFFFLNSHLQLCISSLHERNR